MRNVVAFALLICVLTKGPVENLISEDFEEFVNREEPVVVKFYASWCGHCKKLEPVYEAAAEAMEEDDVFFARIDVDIHRPIGQKYEIEGYPTIKLFHEGKVIHYTKSRSVQEIVSWIKLKTSPAVSENTLEGIQKEIAFLYFVYTGEKHKKVIEETAKKTTLVFHYCSSEECKKEFGEDKFVFVEVEDKVTEVYEGEFTADALLKWINLHSEYFMHDFDEETADLVFGEKKSAIFFYEKGGKRTSLRSTLKEISRQEGLLAVRVNLDEELSTELAEYMGIEEEDAPCVWIHEVPKEGREINFKLKEELTAETVKQFVSDWKAGKLKRELRSQRIPEHHDDYVLTVVGKNFEKTVKHEGAAVLVMFYDPLSSEYDDFMDEYDDLAEELQANHNLVIAKLDAHSNEVPSVNVKSYPTFVFYGEKDKTPVYYNQQVEIENIRTFLGEQGVLSSKDEL